MKIHFRRILCATNLSDFSNSAVIQAIGMAREFGSTLFICHVVDLPMVTMHGAAFVYPEDQIEEMKTSAMDQIKGLVTDSALNWEPVVETGPVSSTLCRLAVEKQADLAIVSTHGRTGLRRLFLGSVTERLLRTIACPLMVVTPPEKAGRVEKQFKGFGFKQIMVGCDFSADSGRAVEYGFSLAQEFEAAIHLVHVVESFVYQDTMLPEAAKTEALTEMTTGCRERLEALVPADANNWCKVQIACEAGKPFQALKRYAETHQVDLIVLGVRGHSLVETMFLGSTTDRVIRGVASPVLSVCPP
ncbi:MAG: universal stress protein [Desulfosarcina sp.]|nr:universal stress protein [Desulfosarcina sp.]MBC2741918.1 universal stress protein [Desulfosarcina sp.]MBC2764831.1 universal stress protein [Desulfosarcina sp.]